MRLHAFYDRSCGYGRCSAFRNYIWTDTGTYIYTGTVNRPEEYTESLGSRGKVGLVTALQMDRFFRQKKMDQLFREYRDKVKQQRQNGQIVSDLEDILNEDVLALYSWQGVVAQIPGTLTGLGILGTFIGLLRGLRNINFVTVEAALSSVQSILTGIDTAFYTS